MNPYGYNYNVSTKIINKIKHYLIKSIIITLIKIYKNINKI